MYGLLVIAMFGGWSVLHKQTAADTAVRMNQAFSDRLDKLWVIAQEALQDKKYLRAEKALLTILRVDERNATAYNRLGILYAKQKEYNDAIECFEIAQSLEPNASSLHNVGLIYYETNKLDKALLAFEQALEMESNVPARYIAYAKVQEKLGHIKKAIQALEKALQIERTPQALRTLADVYQANNQQDKADALRQEVQTLLATPRAATHPAAAIRQRMRPQRHM